MVVYNRFADLTMCIVLGFALQVLTLSLDGHPQASSSLAPYLGKEYVLEWSEDSGETLQAWNYSHCEKRILQSFPYSIKLTEENGKFLLNARLEPRTMNIRFQLGKVFESRNGGKTTITLNGTTLILNMNSHIVLMNFTADEMKFTGTDERNNYTNYTTFWKPRQVQNDYTCCKPLFSPSQRTRPNAPPALAPALGKEYVLEHSIQNQESLKSIEFPKCDIDFVMNTWSVFKLTEDQDELVLSFTVEVVNTGFYLGEATKDNSGQETMLILDGTALSQVPSRSFGHRPRTVIYKFGQDELQLQEVVGGSNSSLIFKPRNSRLS